MATSTRRSVGEIVAEFVARIRALRLTPAGGEAAFERVELFDSEDLEEAFRYLLITEQRVAVVVGLDEEFERVTGLGGRKLLVKRMAPVAVLVSDRVLGDRKAGLWGGPGIVGADALGELVLAGCTGLLLAAESGKGAVESVPVSGSVGAIADIAKGLPGRALKVLTFECRGGVIEAEMGRGPVL